MIEQLETTLHVINEARLAALALEREFPMMTTRERCAAQRRRLHLKREIAAHASELAPRNRPQHGALTP